MSFEISAVGGSPPTRAQVAARRPESDPGSPAEVAGSDDPVRVDTIPSTPPPEVQDAIGVAAQAYEKLAAGGRQLHFRVDEASGRVVVEVHDAHGNPLSTVPPSKALDVAAGGGVQ